MAEPRLSRPAPEEASRPSLPPGWVWTTLGETCDITMGQSPPSSTYNTEQQGLPFFQGKAEFGALHPTPQKWCTATSLKIAQPEDVLISVRAPVGPTNLADSKCAIGRGLAAIHPLANQPSRYYLHYLRSIEQEWGEIATGTTFKAITKRDLHMRRIPLAPLAEQRRIVARIEALFARLNAIEAGLQQLQRHLKRYRAAVLQAAVEGRLVPTEAELARAKGRPYETGDDLLRRILAERRRRWEAQAWAKLVEKAKKKAAQARRRAQGLPARLREIPPDEWEAIPESEYRRYLPRDDRWKRKYRPPVPPDTSNLPSLPEGWVWATIEQVHQVIMGQSPPSSTYNTQSEGLPFFQGKTEFGNLHPIPQKWCISANAKIAQPGSILISIRAPVGPTNLTDTRCVIGRGLAALHPFGGQPARYHLYYLRSVESIWQYKATGTTFQAITGQVLKAQPVPLPPLAEQQRIVAEVERHLALAREAEAVVARNLKRVAQLRQAILKQAFEGKLVPQDPNDEPAVHLLARIRRERAAREAAKKKQASRRRGKGRGRGKRARSDREQHNALQRQR